MKNNLILALILVWAAINIEAMNQSKPAVSNMNMITVVLGQEQKSIKIPLEQAKLFGACSWCWLIGHE